MRPYFPSEMREALDDSCVDYIWKSIVQVAAKSFVDIREEGPNSGYFIELMQKTVNNKAEREPYCVAFVQTVIAYVEYRTGLRSRLPSTESSIIMWNSCPEDMKSDKAFIGAIVVWQWKGTNRGHAGIVTGVFENGDFRTVEANTNAGDSSGFSQGNEGEGIYSKVRPPGDVGDMVLLGFITPF